MKGGPLYEGAAANCLRVSLPTAPRFRAAAAAAAAVSTEGDTCKTTAASRRRDRRQYAANMHILKP